ncbi:MAG: hypothetical protein RBR81_12845 [Bacteroidales bacterium]|jgi:hypothetical protein|nr:hypothetical protein [Bacteroidales bacterium]
MKFVNYIKISVLVFAMTFLLNGCERKTEDFSGTYCINIQNMDMTIVQTGLSVTFTLQSDILQNGTGEVKDNTLTLTATTSGSETFTSQLTFSGDRQSFSGPFIITGLSGETMLEGILLGTKGECAKYDISANGIPRFAETDFTQLSKIEKISKFRSGFGHSFTDGSESCRSMKHYYNPYVDFRQNNNVEVYSPVDGTIISVLNDGHGASTGLTNKQIEIKPDDQPAFVYILYHCDLASADIATGKKVSAGDLIGYAKMYYADLQQYATSFDIAAWVNTPSGMQLISWFETLKDDVFANYVSRGVPSRDNFIITREARDSDPLQCNGETFLTSGSIDNWVILN